MLILTLCPNLLALFVRVDDFPDSLLVVQGVQDFVEARVPLLLVHEVDELIHADQLALALRAAGEKKEKSHTFILKICISFPRRQAGLS